MRNLRLVAVASVASGLLLLTWLLYDATSVLRTLRLGGVKDEATVALVGLGVGVGLVALGFVCWRSGRSRPAAATAG